VNPLRSGTDPPSGLCSTCRHSERVRSAKGSLFVLCALSRTNPHFPKYPRLPVVSCSGYLEKEPDTVREPEGPEPYS
jgi:hypothetical protein